MSNRLLQFVVFTFSILIAVYFGFFQSRDETQKSREIFHKRKIPVDLSTKPPSAVMRNPSSVLPTDPPIGRMKAPLTFDEILDKYGSSYEFTKDTDGVVTQFRRAGDNVRGVRRFSPSRYTDLVSRGEEILKDFRGVLGLDPKLPLASPAVVTGESTGQVTFTQTLEGNRVEPWGKISILLNKDGSIENLQSNALKNSKVLNSNSHPPQSRGSRRFVWVEQLEPIPHLRFVDETRERGIQRVYDAESGEFLFERDRRNRFAYRTKRLHY